MDIQFYGRGCITIATKKVTIVVGDDANLIDKKNIIRGDDVVLFTAPASTQPICRLSINHPGEYEISGVSIVGIPAQLHIDEPKTTNGTMYTIDAEDIRIAVLGNIDSGLNEEQIEKLGIVDVLVVPVGGNGLTLDPIGATKVIKEIEPKIVIPVHYADNSSNYDIPQQPVEEFLKVIGKEGSFDSIAKLKLKKPDIPELMSVVVLDIQ